MKNFSSEADDCSVCQFHVTPKVLHHHEVPNDAPNDPVLNKFMNVRSCTADTWHSFIMSPWNTGLCHTLIPALLSPPIKMLHAFLSPRPHVILIYLFNDSVSSSDRMKNSSHWWTREYVEGICRNIIWVTIPEFPGSVVGIATGYRLDGPGIETRWWRDFPLLSRPALGSTQPPV
jgi:hypothetical protein